MCADGKKMDSSRNSTNFALLLIIVSFTTFGSSMVSGSAVTFLVKSLAVTVDAVTTYIGILVAVSSVAMVVGNLAGGYLADHIGRKRTILSAGAILVPSLFAYSFVSSVFLVVVVYFVHMFAISLFQPAFMAFVADLSRLSSRGKTFGHFNVFWLGSTVPAPLAGGYLVDTLGLSFPFLVGSLVAAVGLIASTRIVGASMPETPEVSENRNGEDRLMPFRRVLLVFGSIALFSGLANGLLGPLIRDFPLYVLNVDATQLGLIFSLGSGLATALVQIPGGRWADRFGRRPLLLLSSLGAPFVVGLAFTGSVYEFILMSAGLVALGNLATPAYQASIMELVSDSKRAKVWGLANGIMGVGQFFGPFISTWLWETQSLVVVPFFVAAIPWILQIPPILKLKETKSESPQGLPRSVAT